MLRRLEKEIEEAYGHAHDCAERAKVAITAQERADWLFVEAGWLTPARSLEFTRRLEDFSDEVKRKALKLCPLVTRPRNFGRRRRKPGELKPAR